MWKMINGEWVHLYKGKSRKRKIHTGKRAKNDFQSLIEQYKKMYIRKSQIDNCVYLFKCQNLYKIGFTAHPIKRLQMFDTTVPFKKQLIFCADIPYAAKKESTIKSKFNHKLRYANEWFEFSEDDVEYIKKLCWVNP